MARSRPHTTKQEIFRVLSSTGVAMSAYEILDAMRPRGISAPIIVYRALNLLVQEGLAYRLESTNAYVARVDPSRCGGFPTLAICSDCGAVEELFDDAISRRLHNCAGRRGFEITSKAMEIKGRCSSCQASAARL
jgi:Fur family transcriptional regulator, zinc uptake regulator